MFRLYDNVVIKSKNISGIIVDIRETENRSVFTVESNVKGKREDGYGGTWPIFDCFENDLELDNDI